MLVAVGTGSWAFWGFFALLKSKSKMENGHLFTKKFA